MTHHMDLPLIHTSFKRSPYAENFWIQWVILLATKMFPSAFAATSGLRDPFSNQALELSLPNDRNLSLQGLNTMSTSFSHYHLPSLVDCHTHAHPSSLLPPTLTTTICTSQLTPCDAWLPDGKLPVKQWISYIGLEGPKQQSGSIWDKLSVALVQQSMSNEDKLWLFLLED